MPPVRFGYLTNSLSPLPRRLLGELNNPVGVLEELDGLAEQVARLLADCSAPLAAELLSALGEQIARRSEEIRRAAQETTKTGADGETLSVSRPADPSDAGAPPGAPRPVPPSPEVIARSLTAIDEKQIAEDIRAIEEGRGRTLDQFIGELEELARRERTDPRPD
jgi:hypothetical protein